MLNKDSADAAQQSSSLAGLKAGAAAAPDPDPRSIIETASGGDGTVNDPPGTDTKPPGVAGLDYLA